MLRKPEGNLFSEKELDKAADVYTDKGGHFHSNNAPNETANSWLLEFSCSIVENGVMKYSDIAWYKENGIHLGYKQIGNCKKM